MIKSLSLSVLFFGFFLTGFSQSNIQEGKECRISTGIGFGGATGNAKSVGRDVWLQLDYHFAKNVSVAMEFENLSYSLQGHYPRMPDDLDGINVVVNNFSLLFKYHLNKTLPVKFAVASGWTYAIKTRDYYYYGSSSSTQDLRHHIGIENDYEIPLLLEARYPIFKALNVQARVKCSLNVQNQSTYSSGIGLSLQL